jgi:hypothetical protein
MDLGAQAAARAAEIQTPFFRPSGMLMRPDDGGIDDKVAESIQPLHARQ